MSSEGKFRSGITETEFLETLVKSMGGYEKSTSWLSAASEAEFFRFLFVG